NADGEAAFTACARLCVLGRSFCRASVCGSRATESADGCDSWVVFARAVASGRPRGGGFLIEEALKNILWASHTSSRAWWLSCAAAAGRHANPKASIEASTESW